VGTVRKQCPCIAGSITLREKPSAPLYKISPIGNTCEDWTFVYPSDDNMMEDTRCIEA
jgi:hypothetical protein